MTLLPIINGFGQTVTDSIYNSWWVNKDKSIFQTVDNGTFAGTTNGYIQLKNGKDTLVLDFQTSKTTLNIIHDPEEIYDKSTKKYSTKTTSKKSTLIYETYALANVLTITANGLAYSIGTIDGACDMPILGLSFNYCQENNIEYLTLFVTKSLQLTTTAYKFHYNNLSHKEASINEKRITVLPGSTLILTINK